MAQTTIEKQKNREEFQKSETYEVKHKGNVQLSENSERVKFYIWRLADLIERGRKADFATEKHGKLLESKATDVFLPLGVMVSLLVHDTQTHGGGDSFMYAGLELRILPSFVSHHRAQPYVKSCFESDER
jgi:hypothetical protein